MDVATLSFYLFIIERLQQSRRGVVISFILGNSTSFRLIPRSIHNPKSAAVMGAQPETPSSMAQSAKNTIQASASQVWSSIRNLDIESMKRQGISPTNVDGVQQHVTSIENVMRTLFSSCTTGGGAAVASGMEDTMKFTTAAMQSPPSVTDGSVSFRRRDDPEEAARNLCPSAVREEAVYERLFIDSKLRAEEAVYHLREQLEQKKEEWASTQKQTPLSASHHEKKIGGSERGGPIPKPFPVSNPSSSKAKREISIPSKVTDNSGPSNAHRSSPEGVSSSSPLHTNMNMSFDDGISEISAATLQEMAKMYEADETLLHRVYSDITQDPAEPRSENWKKSHDAAVNAASPQRSCGGSSFHKTNALNFTRTRTGRSHGTLSTHRSKGARSMATKSTLSTQTTDFANAFRRDEQKYWQDVVKEDDMHNDPAAESSGRRKSGDLRRPDMVSLFVVSESTYFDRVAIGYLIY